MAVKSLNEIIPRLQETNTGVTATPAVYIDDMFDPIFNRYAREYLSQKYGPNPLINTPLGYLEGITNAWGNKQGQGILGPTMGVLGYFGRSLDKADDFLLGSLIEGTDPTGYDNPLEQIFIEDRPYEGKELIKNLINQTRQDPNRMITDEELKGFLPTVGGLAIDLATDPGILGTGLAKIGAKSTKPVLKNLGKVGEVLSDYDDMAAMLAWNAVAPGSTFAAKKFLQKAGDLIGWRKAKDLADQNIGNIEFPNVMVKDNPLTDLEPLTKYVKNTVEEIAAKYTPVDLTKPNVVEVVEEIAKIEAKLPEAKLPDLATPIYQDASEKVTTAREALGKVSKMVDADTRQTIEAINKNMPEFPLSPVRRERQFISPYDEDALDKAIKAWDNQLENIQKTKGSIDSSDFELAEFAKEVQEAGGLRAWAEEAEGTAEVAGSIVVSENASKKLKQFMEAMLPEEDVIGTVTTPKRFAVRPSNYTTLKYYAPVKEFSDEKLNVIKRILSGKVQGELNISSAKKAIRDIFKITPILEEYLKTNSKILPKNQRVLLNVLYGFDGLIDNMFGKFKPITKKSGIFQNTFEAYKLNISSVISNLNDPNVISFLKNSKTLLKNDGLSKLLIDDVLAYVDDMRNLTKGVESAIANSIAFGEDVLGSSGLKLGTLSPVQEFFDTYPLEGTKLLYDLTVRNENLNQEILEKIILNDDKVLKELSNLFPGFEIQDMVTKNTYKSYVMTLESTGMKFAAPITKKTPLEVTKVEVVKALTAPALPTPDPIKVVKKVLTKTPVEGIKDVILREAAILDYGNAIPQNINPVDFAKNVSPFTPGRDSLFKRINNAMVSDIDVKLKNKVATLDNPVISEAVAKIATVKDREVVKQFIKELDEAQPYVTSKGTFLTDLVASRGFKLTIAPTQEAYVALRSKLQKIANAVNAKAGKEVLILNKENARRIVGIQLNTKLPRFQDAYAKVAKLQMDGKLDLDDEIIWWANKQTGVATSIKTGDAKILEESYNAALKEAQQHMIKLGHKEALDLKLKESTSYLHHTALKNDDYTKALLDTFDDINMEEMGKYSQAINNALNVNKKFRSVFLSRGFEGPMSLYKDKALGSLFVDDDLGKIVNATMSDGVLDNQNYQLFVNLFDNDNLKIRTMFKGPKDLKAALLAGEGGNLAQMDLAVPIYKDGTLQSIKRFDKFSEKGLQQALDNPDTVLIPNALFAPLDRILKKDVILSNKAYALLNKYFTLPFKFGVLLNPGFPIGNISNAFFESVTQNQIKFGKSFMQASADFSGAMGDIIRLNNKAYDIVENYTSKFARPNELITPELLIKKIDVRERFFKYMDTFGDAATKNDKEIIKMWLILNNIQDTTVTSGFSKNLIKKFNEGIKRNAEVGQEIAKGVDVDIADVISKYTVQNGLDRVLYGSDKTWGLFLNNPVSRSIMGASKGIENLMRSAHILSNLKYNGAIEYINKNIPALKGQLDSLSQELNIKLMNSLSTMNAANFNYDDVTDIMAKLSMAIPFPTFFTKNLVKWLDIAIENPQILDNIISVHENLWDDKKEAVKSDEFVGKAKGRGAIPALGSLYKPTPYAATFSAFDTINDPIPNIAYRLNPMSRLLTQVLLPSEDVKYRPYTTDIYTKNVKRDDPNFNYLRYALQSINPFERQIQSGLRLPAKLERGQLQPADVLPSVFQPYFEKKKKRKK
jgi:hypothetical protein